MSLNLLHLSDIHFKYALDGSVHDLDHDVRNELIIDVEAVTQRSGPIDAVVVTGDIAFAGGAADYAVAQKWLKKLCDRVGCDAEHVWIVPGNHDVDRNKVTPIIRGLQESIQRSPLNSLDQEIRELVLDDEAGEGALFSPMTEYHVFAAKYNCKPKSAEIAWQSNLKLNDSYLLRLVGLNSALVSNDKDHESKRKLIIGNAQLQIPRKRGVLYLTLCHHPLAWLKDADSVSSKLNTRVSLQLFGHVHEHAIQQVDRTLIVQAGALQPDRQEDPWYPSYNVLSLNVVTDGAGHCLSVSAYPRKWSDQHCFVADPVAGDDQVQVFTLAIDDALSLAQPTAAQGPIEFVDDGAPTVEEEGIDVRYGMTDPAKQLVYAYLTLPYTLQMRIADKLSLLSDDDAGLANDELFEQVFMRAKERDLLPDLWTQVSAEQPDLEMGDNPY